MAKSFNNIFLMILLSLTLLSCSSLEESKESKQAHIYFKQGTNNLRNRSFSEALQNLRKAAKLAPKRSDIFNNLGMAYYFKGKKNTAVKYIKRSIKLDQKNTEAKSNLASIYSEAKKYGSAKKIYLNILKDLTYRKHFQTYYNLGVLELKRKNKRLALNYFKKSVNENPYSCGALFQLGTHELSRKNYKTAIKYFEDGSDASCSKSQANAYYLGLTKMKMGDYLDANRDFSIFKRRFPKSKYSQLINQKLASMQVPVTTPNEMRNNDNFENFVHTDDGSNIIIE